MSAKFVVLKGKTWARPVFDGWTKRVTEAGLFTEVEARAFVAEKESESFSYQPLRFYENYLRQESAFIEEKLSALASEAAP